MTRPRNQGGSAERDQLLLVEGESDRPFFERVCDELKLSAQVQVAPPRVRGGSHNNKEGVFRLLPTLIMQLNDGSLKRLSVVVDADFDPGGGLGYQRTLDRFAAVLNAKGYTLATTPPQLRGMTFKHSDGLPDLGLWIMPGNRRDGALEDFITMCVSQPEQPLFQHAERVVSELPQRVVTVPPQPKFSAAQRTKAEVASWLAWQRLPGRDLAFTLEEDLLDRNSPSFIGFTEWLRRIHR